MPIMIPDTVDPRAPASERRIFELFKRIPDAERWIVLHSLGLSNSYSGEYGEIDFVVIIPDSGIVCLEVKGGGVSCANGIWSTVDQHGARHEYKRSPFAQVQQGMWKLVRAIRTHFGENSAEAACAIGWAVVFPDIASPPPTTEFRREEVIDRGDLLGDWKMRLTTTPSLLAAQRNRGNPSRSTCDRLLKFLRPDFERIGTISSDHWDTEERIRTLTEEQYAVLDALSANRTCLVYGPAGTGKTLLAVEAAKRSASNGHPTLLTCFNRNLGRWLSRSVEGVQQAPLASGNLHKILRDRIMRSSMADEFLRLEAQAASKFFAEEYYELGALAIAEIGERFDTLLVDEVQDFPMKGLIQVVREWTGGDTARIMLFGDYARQAIYDASTRERNQVTAAFAGIASFALSLNCRNTRMIATQIELIAGPFGGRVSDRQPEGQTVEYFYHSDAEKQIEHLEQVGMTLRRQGYKAEDIIILSPGRFETGPLARLTRLANWSVNDFERAGPQDIARSTIHAYKGLERAVVILADIDTKDAAEADNLLYVGMSRARTRLFLLCSTATRELINERIISSLKLSAPA
jgi:UvrD-like helicase C-terminal domain/Nuclease-related domain/AAA domain